jgi:hypothetical protein
MPDSTIKNLTEKTSLGSTDLLVAWDSSAAETKKCKPSALDSQIFSKTQKSATTTGTGKDILVVSYDTSNTPTVERLPYNTAKTDVVSSITSFDGSKLSSNSVSADKLAATLDLSGKTVILPSNTSAAPSASSVTTSSIADGAITTVKIANSAVTADKLASGSVTAEKIAAGAVPPTALRNGGLEVASAWAVVACDLVAGALLEIPVGSGMTLNKTTSFQDRVTVTTNHALAVGDWVCFGNTVLTPTTNTNWDAYAWASTDVTKNWVNDVIKGADVNATQLTPGQRYVVKTVGTTNWTPAGASFNRAGDVFVANATSLSGTGVAQVVTNFTPGIWPVVSVNGSVSFDFQTLQTVPEGLALLDFIMRPVRILRGLNIKKIGRINAGRFRIYWTTPFSTQNYVSVPTAQSAKDVVVSAGTVRSTTTYTDIVCAVVPDEMRFVTFG